jgi:hypothetical protein
VDVDVSFFLRVVDVLPDEGRVCLGVEGREHGNQSGEHGHGVSANMFEAVRAEVGLIGFNEFAQSFVVLIV